MGSLRFATTGFGPAAAAGCGAGAAVCAAGVAGSREEAAGRGWAGAGTCCHGATVCRAGAESLATCEKKYVRPPLGGRTLLAEGFAQNGRVVAGAGVSTSAGAAACEAWHWQKHTADGPCQQLRPGRSTRPPAQPMSSAPARSPTAAALGPTGASAGAPAARSADTP